MDTIYYPDDTVLKYSGCETLIIEDQGSKNMKNFAAGLRKYSNPLPKKVKVKLIGNDTQFETENSDNHSLDYLIPFVGITELKIVGDVCGDKPTIIINSAFAVKKLTLKYVYVYGNKEMEPIRIGDIHLVEAGFNHEDEYDDIFFNVLPQLLQVGDITLNTTCNAAGKWKTSYFLIHSNHEKYYYNYGWNGYAEDFPWTKNDPYSEYYDNSILIPHTVDVDAVKDHHPYDCCDICLLVKLMSQVEYNNVHVVTDNFHAEHFWRKLTVSTIEPSKKICVNDNVCPVADVLMLRKYIDGKVKEREKEMEKKRLRHEQEKKRKKELLLKQVSGMGVDTLILEKEQEIISLDNKHYKKQMEDMQIEYEELKRKMMLLVASMKDIEQKERYAFVQKRKIYEELQLLKEIQNNL